MQQQGPQFALPQMTPAVRLLLSINLGVFVLTWLLGGELLGAPLSYHLGISWNGLWEYWGLGLLRVVTHQFAHSYVDIGHVLLNMLVLYFFGTMVESEVGRRGMLHLYLAGGATGGALQVLFFLLRGDPEGVAIGASGACYAIMLFAACMAPRMRVIFIVFPVEMRWLVGILVFIGVYATVLEFREGVTSGVAHGGHLGGALYGWIAFRRLRGYYLRLGHGGAPVFARLSRWLDARRRRTLAERQATLDRLLDKVHVEGMSALTPAERRFLERASKDLRDR